MHILNPLLTSNPYPLNYRIKWAGSKISEMRQTTFGFWLCQNSAFRLPQAQSNFVLRMY